MTHNKIHKSGFENKGLSKFYGGRGDTQIYIMLRTSVRWWHRSLHSGLWINYIKSNKLERKRGLLEERSVTHGRSTFFVLREDKYVLELRGFRKECSKYGYHSVMWYGDYLKPINQSIKRSKRVPLHFGSGKGMLLNAPRTVFLFHIVCVFFSRPWCLEQEVTLALHRALHRRSNSLSLFFIGRFNGFLIWLNKIQLKPRFFVARKRKINVQS